MNFFDTNVILYMTGGTPAFRAISKQLIGAGGTVSTQVLNETVNVLRGRKFGFSWDEVREFLAGVRAKCEVVPFSVAAHERGIVYAERFQLQVYDAMIVASAVLAGCSTLYSEDMHDGLVIDGLMITNPYLS